MVTTHTYLKKKGISRRQERKEEEEESTVDNPQMEID